MAKRGRPATRRSAREPIRADDPDAVTAALSKAVDSIIAHVRDECGEDSIERLDEFDEDVIGVLDTGIAGLNTNVFGVGGLPFARVTQISGPPSVGKSALCKLFISRMQTFGYVPHFIDAENSKDSPERYAALNISPRNVAWSDVVYIEDAFKIAHASIEHMKSLDVFGHVFMDSIAAMSVRAVDADRNYDESSRRAAKAAFLSDNLPKLLAEIRDSKVGIVFVNQQRQKANSAPFEDPNYEPGGNALKHACHVHIRMRNLGMLKRGQNIIGIKTRCVARKNKLAPASGTCDIAIYSDGRIEEIDE